MKRLIQIICILILCCYNISNAQTYEEYKRKSLQEYQDYKNKWKQEYREYRDKINAEYAEFMRRAWIEYDVQPAEPIPERPEPPTPVVKEPDKKIEPIKRPLPFSSLVPVPAPKPIGHPKLPSENIVPDRKSNFEFAFYGTECEVPFDDTLNFRLKGVSENHVADVWVSLSNDMSTDLVISCLNLRKDLSLGDWGYVSLVGKMTEAYYGSDLINEARLMQMYILVQSGYMVRMARLEDKLVLLLPSENNIWEYPYLKIKDGKYFILDSSAKNKKVYLYDREFPKEQMLSLFMDYIPELEDDKTGPKGFVSKRYPDMSVSLSVNSNLMDFYKDYPLSNDWEIYARTSLSENAKAQLYPALRKSIEGLGELMAAEKLLNFVQTAFEYKTDGEQFGYEKPFFADETFGYYYCDCEDRSILFSILVHDLLHLNVVMVNYPEHMATAVHFTSDVLGSYFEIEGRKYVICDPTYIGASVGEVMPRFLDSSAKIISIW